MRRTTHPRGLVLLSVTEMWERFSYYGVRGLLVLFLIASPQTGGFGWDESAALRLLGWFVAFAYVCPVVGGIVADRYLGAARAVVIGGWTLVAGYSLLAWAAIPGVISQRGPVFIAGLCLAAVGTGLFKPNITVLTGRLFAADDAARERGFLLFYTAMNVGIVFCNLVIGSLGELVSWSAAFAAAAIAMVLSTLGYMVLGNPEAESPARRASRAADPAAQLTQAETRGLLVIACLAPFAVLFWVGSEQSAGTFNLFAQRHTLREVAGFTVPATWFQSLNALFVLVFAPLAAFVWSRLSLRGAEPPAQWKFVIGLLAMALAFALMATAGARVESSKLLSPLWLVSAYALMTIGELCLWTISLAVVTRFAPRRYVGLSVGLWYLTLAVGGFLAGWVGAITATHAVSVVFAGLAGAFALAALLLMTLTRRIMRWSREARNQNLKTAVA